MVLLAEINDRKFTDDVVVPPEVARLLDCRHCGDGFGACVCADQMVPFLFEILNRNISG